MFWSALYDLEMFSLTRSYFRRSRRDLVAHFAKLGLRTCDWSGDWQTFILNLFGHALADTTYSVETESRHSFIHVIAQDFFHGIDDSWIAVVQVWLLCGKLVQIVSKKITNIMKWCLRCFQTYAPRTSFHVQAGPPKTEIQLFGRPGCASGSSKLGFPSCHT